MQVFRTSLSVSAVQTSNEQKTKTEIATGTTAILCHLWKPSYSFSNLISNLFQLIIWYHKSTVAVFNHGNRDNYSMTIFLVIVTDFTV